MRMAHTVLQQSSGHRGICIDHNGMPLWSANVIDTYASMARALLKHCMRHTLDPDAFHRQTQLAYLPCVVALMAKPQCRM